MDTLRPETIKLIERMERCSLLPYRWNEKEIVKNLREIYRLVDMPFPAKITFCKDIFDKKFAIARAIARARASVIARASAIASAIASASDYDFDWFCGEIELGKNANFKYLEIMEFLLRAKEAGLGYLIDAEAGEELFIAPNPVVKIVNNQFHSDNFPAIEFATTKLFYLNGVNFPEELWQRVVSRKMPFEEILAIKDIDQRTQAMRYGDIGKFFEHTKSQMLDKNKDGELWLVPQEAGLFTQIAYFLRYWCPSTNREYMSGIEPSIGQKKSASEARAWKHWFSLDELLVLQES